MKQQENTLSSPSPQHHTYISTTDANSATDLVVVETHLFRPQRFCSDLGTICGPMTARQSHGGKWTPMPDVSGSTLVRCLLGSTDGAAGLGRRPSSALAWAGGR